MNFLTDLIDWENIETLPTGIFRASVIGLNQICQFIYMRYFTTVGKLNVYFTSYDKIIPSRILTVLFSDALILYEKHVHIPAACCFIYFSVVILSFYWFVFVWFYLFQVSFARPSSESIKFSNLYVSNLPRSMTQQELESLFADFGCIISSKILCNPKAGRIYYFIF